MSDRYFVDSPIRGDLAVLAGSEAHHAIHVKRVKPGDHVVLFDGSGFEFPARVEKLGRAEVELAVIERAEVDRELPIELVLGVALPKGERQRWLVEKAVELGVGRIVPLVTRRAVARPTTNALARLRRTVVESSKQCGRNRLAQLAEPQPWADFVARGPAHAVRLLAHPASEAAGPVPSAAGPVRIAPGRCVRLAVGPEGGFADEERRAAVAAGWEPIDLGRRILRVETAAVLLVAMVTQRVG